ncbi:type II toxin-antitoxin system RelE/ParE family toxin [Flavobacterium sp. DGU11]|uniref:Type II toxin-antitoxin system RelE/ParE family toxin n=1 Tax=Flavobacterium arundinis TaxID=3139143 RepID=A0ABU9I0M2_9FLAO
MATLKVFWSQIAIIQRRSIFEYWNERNKSYSYSRKLNAEINDRLKTLQKNPDIGKLTNIEDVRTLSLGHFSIFYEYNSSSILILSFWDNRQDPSKFLESIV